MILIERSTMKRNKSELDLEEFIRICRTLNFPDIEVDQPNDYDYDYDYDCDYDYSMSMPIIPAHLSDLKHHHHQEVMNDISSCEGEAAETNVLLSSQNLTPKPSILDSPKQSSICGGNLSSGSPVSAGDHDHSDDGDEEDEVETDAGQSEQSLDPSLLKRLRRMHSNRESARRSRKRKQEHLADLQLQAEQLRVENDSLCKQLTNADQQYRDADTNNRVLKSDVEALRAYVKLAEDTLARRSLTCGLNQLLQSQLASPQAIATHNLCRVANVSPTIAVHGDDSMYSGLTVSGNSALGLADVEIGNGNLNNGIGREAVSCVSEIWR